ncbi:DinB family protein [Foetidibacter luteolus]|uniref:DinB family protein n=1 Tax=Foetidibacter luteolus TaxID=2608880 RepID=UPI00129A710E|nr:DinB family protein [Foetidibacter luteolus]
MYETLTDRILTLCDTIPALVLQLPENELTARPAPGKWSKKEILGHLIDSAANNHQRFVRGQFEQEPQIFYAQNEWVSFQQYNTASMQQLLALWQAYNRHLAYIISLVPAESLGRQCRGRDGNLYTLSYLIEDYLVHMEHHLKQIITYSQAQN